MVYGVVTVVSVAASTTVVDTSVISLYRVVVSPFGRVVTTVLSCLVLLTIIVEEDAE